MIQEQGKSTQGSLSVLSPHGPLKLAWIIASHGSNHCAPLVQVGIQPSKGMPQITGRAIVVRFLLLNFYTASVQGWDG